MSSRDIGTNSHHTSGTISHEPAYMDPNWPCTRALPRTVLTTDHCPQVGDLCRIVARGGTANRPDWCESSAPCWRAGIQYHCEIVSRRIALVEAVHTACLKARAAEEGDE